MLAGATKALRHLITVALKQRRPPLPCQGALAELRTMLMSQTEARGEWKRSKKYIHKTAEAEEASDGFNGASSRAAYMLMRQASAQSGCRHSCTTRHQKPRRTRESVDSGLSPVEIRPDRHLRLCASWTRPAGSCNYGCRDLKTSYYSGTEAKGGTPAFAGDANSADEPRRSKAEAKQSLQPHSACRC